MTTSTIQNHASLLREMAREPSKSSRLSQGSRGSPSPQPTLSDFDPENEAIMSTQQLDNNLQKLPALRASAQKYNRFSRPSRSEPPARSEPDYAINTSAIGRAFPDFSQGGTSSDEGSMSIEIGRGAKKATYGPSPKAARSTGNAPNVQMELDEDSLDFAAPMIGDYVVTGTPPLQQYQTTSKITKDFRESGKRDQKRRGPSGLRKEIAETSPPLAKTVDYGSGESGKGSGDHGHTLAAMHARVSNDKDWSHINEERPPTIDLTVRNTRFGYAKNHQKLMASGALPTIFSAAQGLTTTSGSGRKAKSSTPNQGTQQSFLLPDLPNMSELVSGIFEDGTPIFSRRGKSRPSRFAARHDFANVGEIPVPNDEQAIFLSLKLLQDKIAVLEKNQAENEGIIRNLENNNRILESNAIQQKKRASQRSDSALGISEDDDEGRKMKIETNRLASSVNTFQSQLDASNRKVVTAETILRTITQERDSAASQLSVAYVTIKQLQAENEELREENEMLRNPTHRLPEDHKDVKISRKSTGTDGDHQTVTKAVDIQTSNLQTSPTKTTRFANRAGRHSRSQAANATDDADMFDLTPRPQAAANVSGKAAEQEYDESSEATETGLHQISRKKGKGKLPAKSRSPHHGQVTTVDSSRDLTYLSFMDGDEVAKLRKTLEQERIQRKQRKAMNKRSSRDATGATERPQPQVHTQDSELKLPRKSSMKDMTARSFKSNGQEDAVSHAKDISEHNRRHSETSVLSARSHHPQSKADNMTSAFIIPDITIRATAPAAFEVPEPSEENNAMLQALAHHNGKNCTVCKPNPNQDGPHAQVVTIPKPTAVSDRSPTHPPYEEEPTVRPSQSPGLALATVIKDLEDEIAHLKIQFAKYQALYNGHDPALGKRKRKSVQEKMQNLLQAIDGKSDQIYALYDVLEGQKQAGHELNDHEVEITLQSVGIDAASLHLRGGEVEEGEKPKESTNDRHPWDLGSEDESEEDLPWEGIESTIETTKSGFSRSNRPRSAIA